MKRIVLIVCAIIFAFSFNTTDTYAQKHYKKHKKEYKKQNKHYQKHNNKRYSNNHRGYDDDDDYYYRNRQRNTYYHRKKIKNYGPPDWAPAHGYRMKQHVYFPDYYTFYDPYRQGYVYWRNNGWYFTPQMPPFMMGQDMRRARIQILGDIPITTRPERYYDRYRRSYPARGGVNVNINLPIPFGR